MDETPKPEQSVTPPPAGGDEVAQAKGTAWLSYLWILWLIPLLTMKENAFAKFHVKQGIILTIYGFAVGIVGGAIPFLGWFIIAPVGSVILLVLMIMGIVNSLNGKYWKCPLGVAVLAEKWFKF
ncbi:MAG TPA: hypothetical protein VMH22_02375 [bacterium]|nr:hypothetical protein [bacterium]